MGKLNRALCIIFLLMSLLPVGLVIAQETQPTIISFESNIPSITVEAAEANHTPLTLTWHTVGMMDNHQIGLYMHSFQGWLALIDPEDVPLAPNDTRALTIQHPMNFGPPMYRLAIMDSAGYTLDERILTIPYEADTADETPTIKLFTSTLLQVDAATFPNSPTVPVIWEVANRPPGSNLAFDQILPDGEVISVELPRTNLWVPSAGEGPTAPFLPENDNPVRLRLQVVDMVTGFVYAAQELIIPVVLPSVPGATALPTVEMLPTTPPEAKNLKIVSFESTPETIDRGGTVILDWEVEGAENVTIWRMLPSGPVIDSLADAGLEGDWTIELPSYYVDQVTFQLWATDASGESISETVNVAVRCPYTYFFGDDMVVDSCPLAEATDTPAVYQAYEHGFMIWRSDLRHIYVFTSGYPQLRRYEDTWTQGEVIDTGEVPNGLYAPLQGFGKVWVADSVLQSDLGWATSPEQGYTMRTQNSGAYKYAPLYLTLPDGTVVSTVESTWQYVGQ